MVCTSGSAALNYAPAVAEAFFQQIPLIIFTADRPPEWIDQMDGQTIRQKEIFGKHVKASYELPVDYSHPEANWHIERIISEAINLSTDFPKGPIHINVPLREPFYPPAGEEIIFSQNVKIIDKVETSFVLPRAALEKLQKEWEGYDKKLIVAGQGAFDTELLETLKAFLEGHKIPLLADVISNLHPIEDALRFQDVFLGRTAAEMEQLRPNLLITFGKSVISKNLKIFLRNHKPKAHWHIQPAGPGADTFQSLTKVIHTIPHYFFKKIKGNSFNEAYNGLWKQENEKAQGFMAKLFEGELFSEFETVQYIMAHLPENAHLHLANSMAVRYANLMGLQPNQSQVAVFANRGTSGIDGSNSTAVGASLSSEKLNILLTGDLAFFYDRNAFWHNYPLSNLRVIILNNHGGGIFNLIDGPAKLPEMEDYFVTRQTLNAYNTAQDFKMEYLNCSQREDFAGLLPQFFKNDGKPKILEIDTDQKINKEVFNRYKTKIANNYGV